MTTEIPLDPDVQDRAIVVDLADRSYSIRIGANLLERSGALIAPALSRPSTVIVTDENVAALHLATLQGALSADGIHSTDIVVPAGERSKSFAQLQSICDQLLAAGVERGDTIIAFGGGVIGDLAGFAAAILRRGVGFVQIPTTLLAQVDSSVGGKTGINAAVGKNLVGAFHQPRLVLCDIDLLETLPGRELRAGYAEVAKYGLIADAAFFEWLEAVGAGIVSGDRAARIQAIGTSCRAKAEIVSQDERETGDRALLNLGHTFGHALEAATGYCDRLLHGEGVSIGMVLAHRFSERLGLCPAGRAERVATHLAAMGLPVSPRSIDCDLPAPAELLEIMLQDKKTVAGKLTFILTRDIGEAFVARDVAERDVLAFLEQDADLT